MELKKLMVDSKSVWMDFPGLEGFSVEVANLSRKELTGLRKRCTTNKFDRKTRQLVEELDDDKFLVEYCNSVIKSWEGLKYRYLEELLLVDVSKYDPDDCLPYTAENAELLMKNGADFDTWVTETVGDLENFTRDK